jgi:hypothetical protein
MMMMMMVVVVGVVLIFAGWCGVVVLFEMWELAVRRT